MLNIAERKLKNKAKFYQESVERVKFSDNFFDYAFSIDAFHHYSDYEKAMKNIHRMLKKESYLIVVDFSFGKIGNKIFHLIEPGNNKMHTPEELIKVFKGYNFKHIKQKRLGIFSFLTIGKK